ncbi:hypothetical protein EG68_12185 [Paragonimus skrjabini miyazakii]|uniref:Endonuclease/exonuclease/phosphatase domain-containing protein n=1 Tax=Paragonimus skrjabini miyazakii TaxID=59628 RepID=A0A8S9Y8F3_9TREM|nr:hypothetical protein EG68_12185 [Paragonimus skrjabini miyazakii]
MGDFNLLEINFPVCSYTGTENSISARFFHTVGALGFMEHISGFTRWRTGHSPSQLDYLLTNEELMVDNLTFTAPLGLSDHAVVLFNFVCSTNLVSSTTRNRRNFRKMDVGKLRGYLEMQS